MNKEITIYELLGLIKEDKAPYRVKYNDSIYATSTLSGFYEEGNPENYLLSTIFSNDNDYNALNDKVEIIEEYKPIIEKIKIKKYNFHNDNHSKLLKNQEQLSNKLNELIDVVNELAKDKE